MEKRKILRGMKAALDKGYPLEKIIASYIKVGYPSQDVFDSARRIITDFGLEVPEKYKSQLRRKPSLDQLRKQIHPKTTKKVANKVEKKPLKPKIVSPLKEPESSDDSRYMSPKEKQTVQTVKPETTQKQLQEPPIKKQKSLTAVFVLLIVFASLLFVALILLLIFRENVVQFLDSLSG